MEEIIDQGHSVPRTATPTPTQSLPGAGGALTLGILSIVFAGLVGLILGIIGLSISGKALSEYNANPEKYTEGSFKNANAGKICAIIGVSLSGVVLFIVILAVAAS